MQLINLKRVKPGEFSISGQLPFFRKMAELPLCTWNLVVGINFVVPYTWLDLSQLR